MSTPFVIVMLVSFAAPSAFSAFDVPPKTSPGSDPAAIEHFEKRVRPILVDRCFSCHAAVSRKSQGGLRLDGRDALLKGGDSGPAIVPGKPDDSLLLQAIRRTDGVSAMPPKDAGPPLSEGQIADVRRWIERGAVYPGSAKSGPDPKDHWAYQPISDPKPPTPAAAGAPKNWPRGDIDRFLLARMMGAGLKPAEDAPGYVIARRLSTVLTGLPPTPEDLETFLGEHARDPDKAIGGYADRLLASGHFGERQARHWMDLIRYADSAGHEYDYEIEGAWRYRDYLVRAFNRDLPYETLIREHVAGDLLSPRVVDGRNEALLATAWWNLHEAATAPVDLPNDEADRMDNRIDVLSRAVTGLSLGCARCHDHKIDPITTRDYHALFGVAVAAPAARLWANGPALDGAAEKLRALRDRLHPPKPKASPAPAVKLDLKPDQELFADFANQPGISNREVVPGAFARAGEVSRSEVPGGWLLAGHAEAMDGSRFGLAPGIWSGTLSPQLPAYLRSPQVTITREFVDVLCVGEDSLIQVVIGNFQLIRDPIYNNLRQEVPKEWKWVRFHVGRWKGRRMHVELFTGTSDRSHRILHTNGTPKNRFGVRAVVFSDGAEPMPPTLTKLPSAEEMFGKAFLAERAALEKEMPAPERFLGVTEAEAPGVPVFFRGNASTPRGDIIARRSLPAWGTGAEPFRRGSGRLELAESLVSANHRQTTRVIVNRLWQQVFGRGLFATVDNVGLLGEPPSHPEMLDFLARRFTTHHRGSLKRALRELVTSRAFRITSGAAPTSDPENRLLSRYPLRRLDAESVRDSILAAAGTLDRTLGGVPIDVPHELARSGSDSGNNIPESGPVDGARRRSLYLAVRRNIPNAFLDVFDKPAPINTFGRRDQSSVPAQALALLNDPFVSGQAGLWGARIAGRSEDTAGKVRRMYLEAFSRPPSPEELTLAVKVAEADARGFEDLAAALINAKEFIHVP